MDTGVVADGKLPGVGHDDEAAFNVKSLLTLYRRNFLAPPELTVLLLNWVLLGEVGLPK
jgi:hypothetical protein